MVAAAGVGVEVGRGGAGGSLRAQPGCKKKNQSDADGLTQELRV